MNLTTIYKRVFFPFLFFVACSQQEVKKQPLLFIFPDTNYYSTLPIDSLGEVAQHIRQEILPQYWSAACEGYFFWLPDSVTDRGFFQLLNGYDRFFQSDSIKAFSQLARGRIFIEQAAFDTALYCLQDCYALSLKNGRKSRAADATRLIGRCYMKRGDFPRGIEYLLKAYEEYEILYPKKHGDNSRNIESMIEIAGAYQTTQNFEKAQKWYEKAWQTACETKATGYQITTAGRLAGNYIELGKIYEAKYMIDTAFYLQQKYNNPYNEAERYYILADIEKKMGYYDKALQHFKDAYHNNKIKDNIFTKYKYLSGIGKGFEGVGKYDSAMYYYQVALATPDSLQQAKIKAAMSDIAVHIGNYKQALAYQKQSNALEKQFFDAEKNKAIGYLEAKNEIAQKDWELQQREHAFRVKFLIYLLILIFLGLTLLIIVFWSLRQRQKRIIVEQEMALIKAHEQLRAQQLTQTTQNLHAKSKALDAAQKVIALKNALIKELELKTTDEKREQDVTVFRNTKILTAEDWHKFRNLFDKTFPEFDEQQKRQFPNLTNAEIRLLMLLKVGFNNAEIAYALGISVDSVYKARYRLRRKIGITEEYDLEEFAKSF